VGYRSFEGLILAGRKRYRIILKECVEPITSADFEEMLAYYDLRAEEEEERLREVRGSIG